MSDELDLKALLRAGPQPREHHYAFAHLALPRVVAQLPRKIDLERLDVDFFRGLWAEVGRTADVALSDTGLATMLVQGHELGAVIVTLPPAEAPAEAIMVAIVPVPVRRLWVFRDFRLRYFTLELGLHFGDDMKLVGTRTVLCEWTDRGHFNYGDGPPAQVDAFATAVFEHCRPK